MVIEVAEMCRSNNFNNKLSNTALITITITITITMTMTITITITMTMTITITMTMTMTIAIVNKATPTLDKPNNPSTTYTCYNNITNNTNY